VCPGPPAPPPPHTHRCAAARWGAAAMATCVYTYSVPPYPSCSRMAHCCSLPLVLQLSPPAPCRLHHAAPPCPRARMRRRAVRARVRRSAAASCSQPPAATCSGAVWGERAPRRSQAASAGRDGGSTRATARPRCTSRLVHFQGQHFETETCRWTRSLRSLRGGQKWRARRDCTWEDYRRP
jgi:hypothetical protein